MSPQAADVVQPVCIDLTLSDGDDERGPCTPPLQRQGCCTARALSATSCQTPVAFHTTLDAAARLRLARTQQQMGSTLGGGHAEAAARCPAAAMANDDCPAGSCELPSSLHPCKRRTIGDKTERLAAAVAGAGSASSGAGEDKTCALDHAVHMRQPQPAEQAQPGLQLRCSRRVQKRAFDLLSVSKSPLIVAYPVDGHTEQHYIESLDMTADLASALHIDTADAEHILRNSHRTRPGRLQCGFMQRAVAAIRDATNADVC